MTSQDDEDDLLMEQLRRIAAEIDPPPEHVVAAARAALSTRRLDEELAELVMDSELVETGYVRSGPTPVRLLSFESAAVSVELQVEETAAGRSVRGLVAGAAGEVVLETLHERRTALLDEDGWFTIDGAPAGNARFRLRTTAGAAVMSSWVSL